MKLKLEIEGANLYEIADKLTKVAADLITARLIENKEKIVNPNLPPAGLKITNGKKDGPST